MLEITLAAVGLLGLGVAASSRWLPRTPLSPPLLATLLGVVLGPAVLGVLVLDDADRAPVLELASELLLAVALMGVALRHPVDVVRGMVRPLVVLLVVVMPAMALSVAGVAVLSLGVPVAVAATIGACLAATDPVLAAGVVTGGPAEQHVPGSVRELLSVESGANDGLALPLVLGASATLLGGHVWAGLGEGLAQVAAGAAAGAVLGWAAGRLLRFAERHHDITDAARLLFTLVLAVTVLGIVGAMGANALIGVFAAGLAHNATVTSADREPAADIDEGMNQFLVLPTFALFGAVLPWGGWVELRWGAVGFVVGVLVLRRLPWTLLLGPAFGWGWREAVWFGWFGPIGVAAMFALAHLHERGVVDPVVWHAGSLAVVASTLVHALTAPLGRWLVRDVESPAPG